MEMGTLLFNRSVGWQDFQDTKIKGWPMQSIQFPLLVTRKNDWLPFGVEFQVSHIVSVMCYGIISGTLGGSHNGIREKKTDSIAVTQVLEHRELQRMNEQTVTPKSYHITLP